MNALTKRLGRFLFPRQQPGQQEREAMLFLTATGAALVFAVVVASVILWQNYSGKFSADTSMFFSNQRSWNAGGGSSPPPVSSGKSDG